MIDVFDTDIGLFMYLILIVFRVKFHNVGYMGRSNPWGNLDQLSLVAPHMVDVITCAIFGDYRLRGVGVVKGFAFSH